MRVYLAPRKVEVDEVRCTGCATCAQVCPTEVLDIIDRKARPSRPEDCMGCQLCESSCPSEAIRVQRAILRLTEKRPPPRETVKAAPLPPEERPEVMVRGKPLSHFFREQRVEI